MPSDTAVRIAAVQPALAVGEVERNLRHVEDLVRDAAREHAPDVILLPESMTSPNVYARSMRRVARPVDGEPFALLRRLARELDCVVGGGFHAIRGADVYGTYVLAEPNGSAHLHDKDIPTCWEHNYYRRGHDDGVLQLSMGPVGCASGWEWSRSRTARRLRGRVRLLVGGMCWPSFPDWLLTRPWLVRRERPIQRELAREAPGVMAKLLGVPVAMASHVGDVRFDSPMLPGVAWRAPMIGETQVCDRDGRILARLTYEDGEGHVSAAVKLAPPAPLDPVPDRFWATLMPTSVHLVWHPYNLHGRAKYQALKLLRRHPWQLADHGDVPNEVPAERGEVAEATAPDAPPGDRAGAAPEREAAGADASASGASAADGAGPDGARDGEAPGGDEPPAEPTVWVCDLCSWVYDPEEGDPDGGIEPGTAFEDIPDDWMCPVCGARKGDFRPLEKDEALAASGSS